MTRKQQTAARKAELAELVALLKWQREQRPIPQAQGGLCRQCFRPRERGWVTCGRSACQEAEAKANRERTKRRKKARIK